MGIHYYHFIVNTGHTLLRHFYTAGFGTGLFLEGIGLGSFHFFVNKGQTLLRSFLGLDFLQRVPWTFFRGWGGGLAPINFFVHIGHTLLRHFYGRSWDFTFFKGGKGGLDFL